MNLTLSDIILPPLEAIRREMPFSSPVPGRKPRAPIPPFEDQRNDALLEDT